MQRIIGDLDGGGEGPLLLVLAAMHGNEKAGVEALKQTVSYLEKQAVPVRGRFLAIVGNLRAVHENKRYKVKDLNRQWYESKVKKLKVLPMGFLNTAEDREQKRLMALIERNIQRQEEKGMSDFVMLDLHTTSAEGSCFSIVNNHEKSKSLAKAFHVPVIDGLLDVVEGTALEYIERMGHPAIAFEGGQHTDPQAARRMQWVVLQALHQLGMIPQSALKPFLSYEQELTAFASHAPQVVRFAYRHPVDSKDKFVMKPGYSNFDTVRKGEILGKDKNGYIKCPADGYILMPLYQSQGDDGFFVVTEGE